ncbi:MAG: glycerol kinase GlpK [Deinococcales bacterium]
MFQAKAILALDQGTTSSRAIIFNHQGAILALSQKEFSQFFPQASWVEHDPEEIWQSQYAVIEQALESSQAKLAAIGITNQRETTIVWDKTTGEAVYKAIVWQDRRTAQYIDALKAQGHEEMFKQKTGLVLDAYFSGSKVAWILDNIPGARAKAQAGQLAFGTVDSWLVWKLTQGQVHATDVSNASRTLLFNIHTLDWDDEILALLNIPKRMLPQVRASSGHFGEATLPLLKGIPISGIAGDQQAATFGQACFSVGQGKNTYGTGCFMLMNTGKAVRSEHQLLSTIAWQIDNHTSYALEGSVFIAGALIQWLRDGLGMIQKSSDIEALAASVPDHGGCYVVPAFAGLGAPYWDQYARGLIIGLTRGTGRAEIARASLESIAYQSYDVVKAMEADAGTPLKELRVDGGASNNNLLMQFQADILNTPIVRPKITETTALGAAYLAGLAVGYWQNPQDIETMWAEDRRFEPNMLESVRQDRLAGWHKAVKRSQHWLN